MENEHQYSGARCSGQAAYVAKEGANKSEM